MNINVVPLRRRHGYDFMIYRLLVGVVALGLSTKVAYTRFGNLKYFP